MEELQQRLELLTTQHQQLVTAHQELQQRVQQPRMNLKLEQYLHKQGDDFNRWVQHAKHVKHANGWTDQQGVDAVLASMHGAAADITQAVDRTVETHTDFNGFIRHLQGKFITPAFQEVARQQFEIRVQLSDEDAGVFHGKLQKLYSDAYGREDEPWQYNLNLPVPAGHARAESVGFRCKRLIQHFIAGLRDDSVRRRIRDSITCGRQIDTYSEALERALAFISNDEQTKAEKNRSSYGRQYYAKWTSAGPSAAPAARKPANDGVEPMDTSAVATVINRSQGGKQFCTFHKSDTHSTKDCRTLKARQDNQSKQGTSNPVKANGNSGNSSGPSKGNGNGNSGKRRGVRCYNCNENGHISPNCPLPRRKKKEQQVNAAGGESEEPPYDSESEFESGN